MSEVEKQESQKTVVAFITGLLIGGLLVWVFSSTPDEKKQPEVKVTDTEQTTKTEEETETTKTESKEVVASDEVVGKGSLVVADQPAGKVVTLGKIEFPTKSGWVVVRDFMDGTPGNVLGAARYSAEEGLVPASVELIRETVKDSSYQVVFFSNKGDVGFSLADDKLIDGTDTTFKAN